MSYKLWLDDLRNSPDGSWVVVKTFREFRETIQELGLPYFISFDHDLGLLSGSGYDCAKWLVENEYVIKDYQVHSQNPVGKENIIGLLENWKKFNQEK